MNRYHDSEPRNPSKSTSHALLCRNAFDVLHPNNQDFICDLLEVVGPALLLGPKLSVVC